MSEEEEEKYFANKRVGWTKNQSSGRLQESLAKIRESIQRLAELDRENLIKTTERLKHVLEKRITTNTDT